MEPLTSHRRSLAAVLLIMLVFGLGLAACGGSAGGTPAVGEPAGGLGTPDGRNSGGGGGADKGSVPFANLADLADRKIVKTGEITLEVPGVGAAIGDVRAMALSLGGYVSGSRAGGEHETATLTVRVPAARFDAALERLHAMDGEVRVEATNEEDVTSAIVDLDARIRNLQASEKQYRVLLGRAEKIDDILAVQSRLDDVRGQIEQLTAQLKQLNGQAALSTVTVTLVPTDTPVEDAAEGWDPGATLGTAVAALVSAGQAFADFAIWLLVVGLPILLVVALVLWIAMRLTPLIRRLSRPTPAAEE
jgi:hypothetical protein